MQQSVPVPCKTPVMHRPVVVETIDDETKKPFLRTSCGDCRRWISDKLITH